MTMPAWMTDASNGVSAPSVGPSQPQSSNGQYDDVPAERPPRAERRNSSRSKSPASRSSRRDRSRYIYYRIRLVHVIVSSHQTSPDHEIPEETDPAIAAHTDAIEAHTDAIATITEAHKEAVVGGIPRGPLPLMWPPASGSQGVRASLLISTCARPMEPLYHPLEAVAWHIMTAIFTLEWYINIYMYY